MKNFGNYQETRTITEVTENEDYYFISQDGIYCGLKKWRQKHDWKSCIPQKGIEGSNPSFSAI